MKKIQSATQPQKRAATIHVAERGRSSGKGAVRCEIGKNIAFSTESLRSYFFAEWDETAFDAFLVAAAVEFADRTQKRNNFFWQREIELRVPVHDVSRWSAAPVSKALHAALNLLTGDRW